MTYVRPCYSPISHTGKRQMVSVQGRPLHTAANNNHAPLYDEGAVTSDLGLSLLLRIVGR